MKQQGFTLMELLITLSIVGIVSALTIPALVTSTRNKANAAKLSSAVLNLENGLETVVGEKGVKLTLLPKKVQITYMAQICGQKIESMQQKVIKTCLPNVSDNI